MWFSILAIWTFVFTVKDCFCHVCVCCILSIIALHVRYYTSNSCDTKKDVSKKRNPHEHPRRLWQHESLNHFGDFTVIFLPYRFWVEFAFATDSRPFLLLFQYVRTLFEWGHPLPIWPGASLTSADLIEYTTWVKFKQAETALPWQPHYSTLRSHFRMHCDFGLDKWWKGMKSNKCVDFGRLLLKRSGWKYSRTVHILKGRQKKKCVFCYFV